MTSPVQHVRYSSYSCVRYFAFKAIPSTLLGTPARPCNRERPPPGSEAAHLLCPSASMCPISSNKRATQRGWGRAEQQRSRAAAAIGEKKKRRKRKREEIVAVNNRRDYTRRRRRQTVEHINVKITKICAHHHPFTLNGTIITVPSFSFSNNRSVQKEIKRINKREEE